MQTMLPFLSPPTRALKYSKGCMTYFTDPLLPPNWKSLSSTLSLKGNILIANQLAASKIFHFISVLTCSSNVLSELQEMLVDFVWFNRRHLLPRHTLFQHPNKGGLGLVSLQARSLTSTFNLVQRYLQSDSHPSFCSRILQSPPLQTNEF